MTAQQILDQLKEAAIEITVDNGNLKVRSPNKITDEQKQLIAANKPILLAHFEIKANEWNAGSHAQKVQSAPFSMPTDAFLGEVELALLMQAFEQLLAARDRRDTAKEMSSNQGVS